MLRSRQPPSCCKKLKKEGLLKEAVRQAPENTDALYRLAYVQYRSRKLVLARSNFVAVVKLALPAHNSHYFLARISLLENKPGEAIQWLNGWYRVPSVWPEDRELNAFLRWFDYSFHSMVFDVCDERLRHTNT